MDYDNTTKRVESPELTRLLAANPLAQFPTLITPDGSVLTETAAIALYLNDQHGSGTRWSTANLTPPQLAAFYRWLVYIPANIYPTITVIEFPERYCAVPQDAPVSQEQVQRWISNGTDERRQDAWKFLEAGIVRGIHGANGKFALGTEEPTILDIYITMLAHWPPHPRKQMRFCSTYVSRIWEYDEVPQSLTAFSFPQHAAQNSGFVGSEHNASVDVTPSTPIR
ncbi:hypothetical protein FRB99_003248 [Tulasnella sp. 403]|nr:hypothetical protein FRB99_003248 [Tulasnella sp. 403]